MFGCCSGFFFSAERGGGGSSFGGAAGWEDYVMVGCGWQPWARLGMLQTVTYPLDNHFLNGFFFLEPFSALSKELLLKELDKRPTSS